MLSVYGDLELLVALSLHLMIGKQAFEDTINAHFELDKSKILDILGAEYVKLVYKNP